MTQSKEYFREYYRKNRRKIKVRHRKYQAEHREEFSVYKKKWGIDNKEKISSTGRQYYKDHREEIMAKVKRYRRKHPETSRVCTARHTARKLGAKGNFTTAEWQQMKQETGNRCVYCCKRFSRLTIDHVVPLISGGSHEASNIVPTCQSCNSKKHSKSLLRFLYDTRQAI